MDPIIKQLIKKELAFNPPPGSPRSSSSEAQPPKEASATIESGSTKTQSLAGAELIQEPEITDSENSLNADFKDAHKDPYPSKPSPHVSAWRDYYESEFSRTINDEAAKIIADAVATAANKRGSLNNLITVNTKEFVRPLTAPHAPLEHLHLDNRPELEHEQERPAWYESQRYPEKMSFAALEAFGSTRPSLELFELLEKAAALSDAAPEFRDLNPWHLAFALISSGPTGFKWQLEAQNSSLRSAAVVLRRNLRNHEPSLEPLFPWSELDLTDDSEIEESPEETDSNHDAKVWSRAFDKIRNPKDFKWSISCGQILDKLWHSHGIAASFARQSDRRAKNFNRELTPRSLLLTCLRSGANTEFDHASPSSGDQELLSILFQSSGKTVEQLDDLLQKEFHRGRDQSAAASVALQVSEKLTTTIARANEIRLDTGNDPDVSARHLIAALFYPVEGGGTGSQVLLSSDGIDRKALLDALGKDISTVPRGIERDQPGHWIPWLERLHQGMEYPLSESHHIGRKSETEDAESSPEESEKLPEESDNYTPDEVSGLMAGSLSEYHRDSAGHEIGGSTKQYARAIASTFLSSGNGDFCFALFGPWGRGKSTLIQQVSEELNGEYTSVTFNAWKFPSRPEVWVWLYETLKKEASGDCLLNKLRLGIQSNLREDHGLPLVFPALLLLFAAIPKGLLLSWTIPVNGIASVIAIALILLYSRRVWNGFGTTLADYLKLPNHGKHLGLQAAIGDDLKRLLATWTGAPLKSRKKPLDVIIPPTFRSRVTNWLRRVFCPWEDEELPIPEGRIAHVRHLLNNHWWFSLAFVFFWISLAIAFGRIGPHATLSFSVAIAILSLATIAFYFAILLPVLRSKTVLLVVDDLDRCPPEEMLAVIESLRVFLDDPEISPKLKIAMLLDREILSHAVCRKYEKLLPDSTKVPNPSNQEDPTANKAPVSRFTTESIVAEQIEKFFLLSFDLPPLESKEAWDIAEKIVGKTVSAPARETQTTSPNSLETVMARNEGILDVADTGRISQQSSHATSSPPSSPAKPNDVGQMATEPLDTLQDATKEVVAIQLTSDEQNVMIKLLHSYLTASPGHPTPRHMRMTKMRYFLARQILTELGSAPNPAELMKHFSHLWIDRRFDSKLAQVVGMVTGRTPEK